MLAALRTALLAAIALVAIACGPSRTSDDDASCTGPTCPDANPQPACSPVGAMEACYGGPPGTEGVGSCRSGMRTCNDVGLWGTCQGEIQPAAEVCANAIDDNCSGVVDEVADLDGDGYTTCEGDCCDAPNQGCASPTLVNPGAFEAAANMVDDDCDGMIDNVALANCDTGLQSSSADPFQYAQAIDLCQTATEAPGDRRWGVVSAAFVLASGTGAPNANQRAIRPGFGGTIVQGGAAFTVLSTGHAATPAQTAPGYQNFQTGAAMGTTSGFPADWFAANGNTLPNAPGCPALAAGSSAFDPVMLQLRIRTPSNARSFSFSLNFFSSEYPEWTCSPFNDFFVVLLDSTWAGTPANPADKNLAVYTSPTSTRYPVGVNLAHGNTGLFTDCVNGATGCATPPSVTGNITTCVSIAGLTGTGMDQVNPPAHADALGQPGYCGASNRLGGGTGWLQTSGNVNGGEIITLRIALWDVSDGIYDSVAIIDNFVWSVEASQPGTIIE